MVKAILSRPTIAIADFARPAAAAVATSPWAGVSLGVAAISPDHEAAVPKSGGF
jgi:hypothetical protein